MYKRDSNCQSHHFAILALRLEEHKVPGGSQHGGGTGAARRRSRSFSLEDKCCASDAEAERQAGGAVVLVLLHRHGEIKSNLFCSPYLKWGIVKVPCFCSR